MATLASGSLSLDVKFKGFQYHTTEHDWLSYDIRLLWQGESIVRDEVLEREGYWEGRSPETFFAEEYEEDGLIYLIEDVLSSEQAASWEPVEPDIKVAIYPDAFFPFLEWPHEFTWRDTQGNVITFPKPKPEDRKPDDLFTLIFFISDFAFKGSTRHSGSGFGLHLIVTRGELEHFLKQLQSEYQALLSNFGRVKALAFRRQL